MNKIKYPTFKLCVLTLTLCFGLSANAESSATAVKSFNLSLGNLCEYVGKIQTDGNGSTNTCSFLPSMAGSLDVHLDSSWAFSPQIGATLPKSGRDENIKRMTIFTLANVKYKTSYVNFIGGAGLYFTRIWGPGGEETLNNGDTSDSFPLPKEPVYVRNFIVNLGLGADFTTELSGELYTYIFNAESSEDRAFSIGFGVTYHFGEVL